MKKHKIPELHIGLVVLIAVLYAAPLFLRTYYLGVATELVIFIILALSFRMTLTTGGWNLAHYAIMGAGAYFSTVMVTDYGWPFWVTLPMSGMAAALVGLLMSFPLSRMREFAYLIGSYAMGEAMRLSWVKLDDPFGGPGGITNIPRPPAWFIAGLPVIDFRQAVPYYFLSLTVMVVSMFVMFRIDRSRLGDTFKSIYSKDFLAESAGINIVGHKRLACVLGSFFAGISGCLLAHYHGAIDPSVFALNPLIILLAWLAVGGIKTFTGPIIGTVSFVILGEGLRPLGPWRPLIYGCVLIGVLLFMPHGLEGLPEMLSPRIKRLRERLGIGRS